MRTTLFASVTPLASIFGSGFLIIVPVLERTVGALSVLAIAGVCALAWFVGSAIRHIVRSVEPLIDDGKLDPTTSRINTLGDQVIVVAYVISVALYVRIMAQYIVGYAGSDSQFAERGLAAVAIAVIVAIGVTRGFGGLDITERVSLIAVLFIVTVLGGAYFISDAGQLLGGGVELPPVPNKGLLDSLLVLGGIVITVQGFETVRYIGDEYDRPTRIRASRFAQAVASAVYIGFVAVATPLMGLGTSAGVDADLLDITNRVVPILALPLVLCAVLSQFSAATADTVAAGGNLRILMPKAMAGLRPYWASGLVAIVLAWTVPTFTIIAVASRAFAAFYFLQCLIAIRTCEGMHRKLAYSALAAVLLAITLLARPAG